MFCFIHYTSDPLKTKSSIGGAGTETFGILDEFSSTLFFYLSFWTSFFYLIFWNSLFGWVFDDLNFRAGFDYRDTKTF